MNWWIKNSRVRHVPIETYNDDNIRWCILPLGWITDFGFKYSSSCNPIGFINQTSSHPRSPIPYIWSMRQILSGFADTCLFCQLDRFFKLGPNHSKKNFPLVLTFAFRQELESSFFDSIRTSTATWARAGYHFRIGQPRAASIVGWVAVRPCTLCLRLNYPARG